MRGVRGGGGRFGFRKRLIRVSCAALACLPRVGVANNCPRRTLVLVWLGAKDMTATQFSKSVSTTIYCTFAMYLACSRLLKMTLQHRSWYLFYRERN